MEKIHTEKEVKMFWRTKKFLFFSVILTLLVIGLPKLYYISQQSVLPQLARPPRTWTSPSKSHTKDTTYPATNPTPSLPLNVLLLAYHRTGSSLMGEILSLISNSAYFFEPVFFSTFMLHDWSAEGRINILEGVFHCNPNLLYAIFTRSTLHVIRKLNGITVRKRDSLKVADLSEACMMSPVRIVKTIRVRMDDIHRLMDEYEDPGFKIIHLVRDPRAMLSSVNQATIWQEEDRTPEKACDELSQEIELGNELPKNVYLRIKYEDVVSTPEKIANKIFKFLGVHVSSDVLQSYLLSHMHAEKNPNVTKLAGEYFSTIRNSSFNTDHWKTEVSDEFVQVVETYCEWVMQELGYKKISTFDSKN